MQPNPNIPCPPGFYPNLSYAEYAALPGLNHTAIEYVRTSPEHFRDYRDGLIKRVETDAIRLGKIAHAYILEGRADYVVSPFDSFRTNEAKAWRDAQTLPILTETEAQAISELWGVIRLDPRAFKLMVPQSDREVSMFADDKEWGRRIKGRADVCADTYFADLKFVADASAEALSNQIYDLGWHRQAALYLRIARILGGKQREFYFIAVEKSNPPRVNVRKLPDHAIELGDDELGEDIALIRRCERSGEWHGYSGPGSDVIDDIDLPQWAYLRWEARHQIGLKIGGEDFGY